MEDERHRHPRRRGGAHIIDLATGAPTADLASVTIVGPDLTYADAYATAVFVMGIDGLNWLAERHPDYAAFLIRETTWRCQHRTSPTID